MLPCSHSSTSIQLFEASSVIPLPHVFTGALISVVYGSSMFVVTISTSESGVDGSCAGAVLHWNEPIVFSHPNGHTCCICSLGYDSHSLMSAISKKKREKEKERRNNGNAFKKFEIFLIDQSRCVVG